MAMTLEESLAALRAATARADQLQRDIDEALVLTECASSLKDMAACCIEGVLWKARAEKAEAALRTAADRLQAAADELGTPEGPLQAWANEARAAISSPAGQPTLPPTGDAT